MTSKVFCIGFHKTGTKSLAVALKRLGYSVTGPNGTDDPRISENVYDMAFGLVERFDAFQDNPWPLLFRELDARYPGSKFVLTLRSPEAWIQSQVRHFGTRQSPMRTWIYGEGCPQGNEILYLERFNQHNREVAAYFQGRPDDLLTMELAKGAGWPELCRFLGREVLTEPFPHANQAETRESRDQPGRRALRFLSKSARSRFRSIDL